MVIYLAGVDANWNAPNGYVLALEEAQAEYMLLSFEKLQDKTHIPVIPLLHRPTNTEPTP